MAENKNYKATITFGGLIGSSFKAATSGVDKALAKVRKEYKGVRDEMTGLRAQIRAGSGDVEAHKRRLAELERQADSLKGRMASLGALTGGQIGTAFRTLSGQVKTLGLTFAALATGATFAGIKVLGDALRSGDEIGETAQYLGLTATALQKFRYAASVAGMESSDFDGLLTKLTVNLAEAGEEGSAMAKVLNELGISYQTLSRVPADDRLGIIIDRLKGIKSGDPDKAKRLMKELAGKSGIKLGLLVDGGSQGLVELGKQAEKLNLIRDKAAIDNASDADNAWRNLSLSVLSLKNAIGDQLMPVFTEWANELTKWVASDGYKAAVSFGKDMADWFRANKGEIVQFFVDTKDGIKAVWHGLNELKDLFGGWGNLMKVGLALYLLPTVAAFSSLAANILKSASALKSLLAIGGAGAGGGAAAGGLAAFAATWLPRIGVAGATLSLGGSSKQPDNAAIAKNYIGAKYEDVVSMFAGMSQQNRKGFWGSIGSSPAPDDYERAVKALQSVGINRRSPGGNSTLTDQEANAIAPVIAQKGDPFARGKAFGDVNITINQAPGQSAAEVAQEVMRHLKGDRLSGVGLHD